MQSTYYSLPPIKTVYYDSSVKNLDFFQQLSLNIRAFPEYRDTSWIEVSDYKSILSVSSDTASDKGKQTLLVYPEKGQFMHACPGSDGVICCRYFVLDFGMNCPYDCHYCYLQSYAKFPILTVAGNLYELLDQLKTKLGALNNFHWRIGTGEYMDSLALEKITNMGKILVNFFAKLENATLELKTKSIEVESLLDLDHRGHTIISWTLNPEFIVNCVEVNCSRLDDRFSAARKVIESGYQVGFHLDPIIFYENWENDYTQLIDRIFEEIPAQSIRWISMGTFRYSPGLKEKLRIKHPREFITRSEMILQKDNKYRYLATIRGKIYKKLYDYLMYKDSSIMVYLCMETQGMWKRMHPEFDMKPFILDQAFEQRRLQLLRNST